MYENELLQIIEILTKFFRTIINKILNCTQNFGHKIEVQYIIIKIERNLKYFKIKSNLHLSIPKYNFPFLVYHINIKSQKNKEPSNIAPYFYLLIIPIYPHFSQNHPLFCIQIQLNFSI